MSRPDRLIVVSGGTGGIGGSIVERLTDDGYAVAVLTRSGHHHPAAHSTYSVDLGDEDSVTRAFAEIDKTGIRIAGAVTAAGVNERTDAIDASAALFERLLSVNVTGTFLVAREAARRMLDRGGSIVTVSSTMAFVGSTRRQAPYSATKGAVRSLTTALAVEWAEHRIRVNSIAPTFTNTPMNAPVLRDPDLAATVLASIPLGRFGEPDDIASAAAWLLSKESSFVTGQTIAVDGGYLAL